MLAMDGIRVMPGQAAVGAGIAHLLRPEDRLHQPQEEPYAEDHDEDGHEAPGAVGHGDVAEAGRGQRRDGEIERVEIGVDRRISMPLQHEDEGRHDEDEDQQVGAGIDHLLVAAEEARHVPEFAQQVIGAQDTQHPRHPQEAQVIDERAGEQRQDHNQVGDGGELEYLAPGAFRRHQTQCEVEAENDAQHVVERVVHRRLGGHGGDQEIADREDVEGDEPELPDPRPLCRAEVELVQGASQASGRANGGRGRVRGEAVADAHLARRPCSRPPVNRAACKSLVPFGHSGDMRRLRIGANSLLTISGNRIR